jgi:hypothetical protein
MLMSLAVGGGFSIFLACLRSLMLAAWLGEAVTPPSKGSRDSLSGLVLGLLSDLDEVNFSFRRLAGEIPRIELEILFRRVDPFVDGSFKVSALSSRSVEGSADVDRGSWSAGEAFGEISIVSGLAIDVLGTSKSLGSTILISEWPSSTVVVVIRGDELAKYPVWESRESSGGGLYVKVVSFLVEARIYPSEKGDKFEFVYSVKQVLASSFIVGIWKHDCHSIISAVPLWLY